MSATLTAGINSLILSVSNPNRDDLIGMKVWYSTTNGFMPPGTGTIVYDGAGLSITINGLTPGITYYVRYALISEIDPTDYEVSAQLSGIPTTRGAYTAGNADRFEVKNGSGQVLMSSDDALFVRGNAITDNYSIGDATTGGVDATFGNFNTAFGRYALAAVGANKAENVGIGSSALRSLSDPNGAHLAYGNVGIGYLSLRYAAEATENVAIGAESLAYCNFSAGNVAVGYRALRGVVGSPIGDANIGVGQDAGANMTTGNSNTLVGTQAGGYLTTGAKNCFFGASAGLFATNVSGCVVVGGYTGVDASSFSSNSIYLADGWGALRAFCDASGRWVLGHTSSVTFATQTNSAIPLQFQMHGATEPTSSIGLANWSSDGASNSAVVIAKSKSGQRGIFGGTKILLDNTIGELTFSGDNFYSAGVASAFKSFASILALADADSDASGVYGRLVFKTARGGAPTTHMTLDSYGRIILGNASISSDMGIYSNRQVGNYPAISGRGFAAWDEILSGITSSYVGFQTNPVTQAASFTLTTLTHFGAYQQAFGAGSAVTSQYGVYVSSQLIGAVNNYAFYGSIPSGTGRWNAYMSGSAPNYFAGQTIFGATDSWHSGRVLITDAYPMAMRYSAVSSAPMTISHYRDRAGVIAVSSDDIARYDFCAHDGSDYRLAARMLADVGATPVAGTAVPGRFVFWVGDATGAVPEAFRITHTYVGASVKLGYGGASGVGGSVTQATSRTTGVTLNTPTGQITTTAGPLNSGAQFAFTLTNSEIGMHDQVLVSHKSGGSPADYNVWASTNGSDGSATIYIKNISATNKSDALVLQFALIRGAIT